MTITDEHKKMLDYISEHEQKKFSQLDVKQEYYTYWEYSNLAEQWLTNIYRELIEENREKLLDELTNN